MARSRCLTPWRAARPEPSQRSVDRIEECAIARVLPARTHVVRDITECDACFRVAKSQRSAGTKVTECACMGTQRPFGLSQLESDAEATWPLVDDVGPVDLLRRGCCQGGSGEDPDTVDRAVFGECRINARDAASIAVTVGRRDFGLTPARRIDPMRT